MRAGGWLRVAVVVAACAGFGIADAQGRGVLVPEGVSPDVALVFTGDTIGYIEPCG